MAARLVEIYVPDTEVGRLRVILGHHSRRFWRETVPDGQEKFTCIVQQRYTERLLEELDREFAEVPSFAAIVAQLEAVLPPVEETPETELPGPADLRPPTALRNTAPLPFP